MNVGFGTEVVQIFDLAQRQVSEAGVHYIGVLNVLSVMLASPELTIEVKQRLDEKLCLLGISPSTELAHKCSFNNAEKTSTPGRDFSPALRNAMTTALEKVQAAGRSVVAPEDLLYGILVEGNSQGMLFQRLGIPSNTNPEVLYVGGTL